MITPVNLYKYHRKTQFQTENEQLSKSNPNLCSKQQISFLVDSMMTIIIK